MITDRQRVELTLLPMLMTDVVINGVSDPASPEASTTLALLLAATRAVLADLDLKAQGKIMRRTKRAHEAVLAPFVEAEARADKVGLLVFYVLQAVTDCDYLVLAEDAPMREAMDRLLPAIAPAAEIEKLNASAKKAARKTLALLQTMGYFDGVGMPEAA